MKRKNKDYKPLIIDETHEVLDFSKEWANPKYAVLGPFPAEALQDWDDFEDEEK